MKKSKKRKTPVIVHAGFPIREVRPGYWLTDVQRDGKRERKCFRDLAEAKTFCEIISTKIRNEGTSALSLTPDQRSDAGKALEKLNGATTLLDAAECWLLHNGGETGLTLKDIGDRFMKHVIGAGCRKTTITERRYKIKRLVEAMGDQQAQSITKRALNSWLDDMRFKGETRDGYRRCFRAMFQFAVDEEIMEHNPAAEIKRIKGDENMPQPFTVADVCRIMATAEQYASIMVPTLAVQFFAGLRPGEAKGLTWNQINFDEKFIRVMPETSKVRAARIVDMNDTLQAWLAPYRQSSGIIGISTQNQFDFYMKKKEITINNTVHQGVIPAAAVKWIQDGPRKTFATMHIAAFGDAGKTATILGHVNGEDVLYKHYRGLATAKEAAAYWQIRPVAQDKKIIHFKTA